MSDIAGPAAAALSSLDAAQIQFLQSLPKAELHAHLNGSIPISVLQELAAERASSSSSSSESISGDLVLSGIQKLLKGVTLDKIDDFFTLFPAIYALTSTPDALRRATRAVLRTFLDVSDPNLNPYPQCSYLELRTTPRQNTHMNRETYLRSVLEEVETYPSARAGLIVSIDRKMGEETVKEILHLAMKLKKEGRRVVGLDLCGDPTAGDMGVLEPYFLEAKKAGLGVTLHIAETTQNTPEETLKLLSYNPDRLGHATFLNEEAISIVLEKKMCIEICLSSNLLCKTVPTLESHHIHQYLKAGHPIAISSDDILPFRTSLLAEYALLLAKPPYGLGLTEDQVRMIAEMSLKARFGSSK
ncbi:Metallo-dependent hydrolase [Agrocybe pediades]|nr:Metallo-dependent hydrolase [Agrocybe pediades]